MPGTYLIIGEPGSGKTTLATTLEHPTLIIDIDNKAHHMQNIAHLVKSGDVTIMPMKYRLFDSGLREKIQKPHDKVKKEPQGFLAVVDVLNDIIEEDMKNVIDGQYSKYKTIVLDSLTRLVAHMESLLIYQTKKGQHGKIAGVRDMNLFSWDAYGAWLKAVFTDLTQINRNLIVLAHQQEKVASEKVSENEIKTTVLKYLPMVGGQFREAMAGYFDEVYYTFKSFGLDKKTNSKREVFSVRTKGNKYEARSSLSNLPEFAEANLGNLIKNYSK